MFVERYTVVPAVDVEALRSALRTVSGDATVTVALGPSLLGTLDMDALPSGMHPFVDPDRRVRPLRDDVVLLAVDDGRERAEQLAATADLVEHGQVEMAPWPPSQCDVLVLVRAQGPDGVRLAASPVGGPERAGEALTSTLDGWPGTAEVAGTSLGADLYVVLPRARLEQALAPRDG